MKVLCLTVERADANAVAAALPGMVTGASATWASRFEDAAHWALANPDVSAFILDAQFGLDACGVFLNRLRRRGIGAQAIVLLTTGHEPTASLGLARHDVVMPRAEFLLGLPDTLTGALSGLPHINTPHSSSGVTMAAQAVAAPPEPHAPSQPQEPSPRAARAATVGSALLKDPTTTTTPAASADRLPALAAALEKAERAREAETAAAEAQLARRTRAFAATVGDLLKARDASERQLKEVALERDRLRAQIASSAHAAQRLTEVEAELQRASAARERAERALAATETQLVDAKANAAEAAAAQTRAEAERRAVLETLAAARRDAADAADRLAREREVGAERLGRREAELSALLEEEIEKRLERETALTRSAAAERAVLEERASEAETRAARAQRDHAATLSDLQSLALDASALEARLADTQAARTALDGQLAEAEGVRLALQSEHAAALFTAAAESAQREAAREQQAAAAAALAADQLAQRDRALADLHAALDRQTDTAAQLRTELAQLSAESAQRRADAERARLEAIQHADVAARQQDQLAAQLAETEAARAALFERLAERQTAATMLEAQLAEARRIQETQRAEHAAALSAAATEFAQREAAQEQHTARVEASLRVQLADADVVRQALLLQIEDLTGRLAHSETDGRRLNERLAASDAALAAAQQTIAAQEARLDVRLGRENELNALLSSAAAAHHAIDAQRLDAERALHEVEDRATRELAAAGEQILDLEARVGDEAALRESVERERDALQQALGSTREDFERRVAQQAAAVAALERAADEHRTRIATLSAQHAEMEQAAEHAVAHLRDDLQIATAAHERDVEQLQSEYRALAQQLDSVEKQRDAAREQAGQVLALRHQLRELRVQMNRQFDEHPFAICRCSDEGVPQRANRAFAELLGCPVDDERAVLEYAATQFSSSRDIAWLAERCRTGEAVAAECVWKTMQGGRLAVRIHARATTDGFDIVVEDRSGIRALEDRLSRTRRLESIGRLASEVATSCDRILADVRRDGEAWVAGLMPETKAEHHVESILTEIARAHVLLQRLDAFADEQAKALEPVDIHRVLRDLEPVLKEIAGDEVEVRLPKRLSRWAAALQVDVKAERLERVLVNAAGFARARMPYGGTITFELEETLVDQPFVDRYPSARIGRHALLTITETRQPIRGFASAGSGDAVGAGRADLGSARRGMTGRWEATDDVAELAGTASEANDESAPADQSGVDLAPLQDLVRTCGGHLWIEAAASGNMVLKIHLPLRAPDERRWPPFGLTAFRSSGS